MIARYRGEHHHRGIWQPRRDAPTQNPATRTTQNIDGATSPTAPVLELYAGVTDEPSTRRSHTPRRTWGKALTLLLAGLAGFAAHQLIVGMPSPSALPATPRQWISAYEAAAIDNPQRVCHQLFAPQLTANDQVGIPVVIEVDCQEL